MKNVPMTQLLWLSVPACTGNMLVAIAVLFHTLFLNEVARATLVFRINCTSFVVA